MHGSCKYLPTYLPSTVSNYRELQIAKSLRTGTSTRAPAGTVRVVIFHVVRTGYQYGTVRYTLLQEMVVVVVITR